MSDIPSRNNWFSKCKSIFDNKDGIIQDYLRMLFNRTLTMFEYEGLPETIPKNDYLTIKQTYGYVTIAKDNNGVLYALYSGLGGRQNEYYHPTQSIVANPYLNLTKTYDIDVDCVVIKNDMFYTGLMPYNQKYAELLTECDLSIRKCLMNVRVDNVLTSSDTTTDASIKEFFKNVENGKFAHITTKQFMDDTLLQIHQIASQNNPLKDLIEMKNYLDASWWMDFGLNANANMKRETLTDAELGADDKTMIPFIKMMLDCEKEGWEKVNKMFGLNVKVRLSDVWMRMFKDVIDEPNNEPNEEKETDTNENIDNKEGGNDAEKDV